MCNDINIETRKTAQASIKQVPRSIAPWVLISTNNLIGVNLMQVEEKEAMKIPELLKHHEKPFFVMFDAEQQYPVYISKVGVNSVKESYSFLGNVYRFYVYAVYEEDAKKKAISYFRTLSKLVRKEQQEEQWYPL